MFACTRRQGKIGLEDTCIHIRSIGGMERGFSVIICRACSDPPCAKVCPTGALKKRKGGGVILAADLCIGCGNCHNACLIGAVQLVEKTGKPSICNHCGYCVGFCPHGVLEYIPGRKEPIDASQ